MERRAFLRIAVVAAAAVASVVPARRWLLPAPDRLGREPASGPIGKSAPEADPPPAPHRPRPGDESVGHDEPDAPTARTVEVICREATGLTPPRGGGRSHTIEVLTLHHTAVGLDEARQAPSRLRGHQRFHQDQGWTDLAYHYGVDLAGNVYELRDPEVAGDTFTDYDPAGHFLVVCEGDYQVQRPSDEMLESVAELFAHAAHRYSAPLATLGGHRDHAATSCPGDELYVRLDEIRAEATRIARSTAPLLEVICGDEGARRVAEIESGV